MKKEKLWEKSDFEKLKMETLSKEDLRKRHQLRYACFRLQKEVLEGVECPEKHKELAQQVEKIEGFEGWNKFAVTWDISTPDPMVIVKRMWSIEQEHQQMLERVALDLPRSN